MIDVIKWFFSAEVLQWIGLLTVGIPLVLFVVWMVLKKTIELFISTRGG